MRVVVKYFAAGCAAFAIGMITIIVVKFVMRGTMYENSGCFLGGWYACMMYIYTSVNCSSRKK